METHIPSDKWAVEQELGHGTFSVVMQARSKASGQLVALKYAKTEVGRELIKREAEILINLKECNCE
jgi:predicted Ser/Thr protein kinase